MRIRRAKSAYRQQRGGGSSGGVTRIHQQENGGDNGGDNGGRFRPAVLSNTLRGALDIDPHDIPEWVYRMRLRGFIDGYPPAYLKRAVERSILPFFVGDDDDNNNSGDKNIDAHETIDVAKIVRYPGFNCAQRGLNDVSSSC